VVFRSDRGRQARWWDGEEWTKHVQALPMGEPPEEEWVETSRLVPPGSSWANRSFAWGIVAIVANALLAPTVLAFVFGVMALRRDRRLTSLGYEVDGRQRARLGITLGAIGILVAAGWIFVLRLLTHHAFG
jgi:Protein of unknown function (DUF2510).